MVDQHLQDLKSEHDDLQARVRELEGELALRKAELVAIHGSKMWRSWMVYHSIRQGVGRLLHPMSRAVGLLGRAVGAVMGSGRVPNSSRQSSTTPPHTTGAESKESEAPNQPQAQTVSRRESGGHDEPPSVNEVRPQVTETVTMPAGPRQDRGQVLVVGIYLADQPNYVEDIVRILSHTRRYEVRQDWVAIGEERPSQGVARVTTNRIRELRPKFCLLNEVLERHDLNSYDYVLICDDDVALPEHFLDQFLTLQARLEFAIAQPPRTTNSYIDLPIVEQHPGVLARQTLFVEQGPVISFHRSTFGFVFPFDLTSPMGWGLENVWSLQTSRHSLRMGIIDNVPVDHSMRKPVANYDWGEADRGRAELFSKVEHRPNEECFRVLELVPFEGRDR